MREQLFQKNDEFSGGLNAFSQANRVGGSNVRNEIWHSELANNEIFSLDWDSREFSGDLNKTDWIRKVSRKDFPFVFDLVRKLNQARIKGDKELDVALRTGQLTNMKDKNSDQEKQVEKVVQGYTVDLEKSRGTIGFGLLVLNCEEESIKGLQKSVSNVVLMGYEDLYYDVVGC